MLFDKFSLISGGYFFIEKNHILHGENITTSKNCKTDVFCWKKEDELKLFGWLIPQDIFVARSKSLLRRGYGIRDYFFDFFGFLLDFKGFFWDFCEFLGFFLKECTGFFQSNSPLDSLNFDFRSTLSRIALSGGNTPRSSSKTRKSGVYSPNTSTWNVIPYFGSCCMYYV